MVVDRFNVHLIDLGPTVGAEIKKARPGVILSPNEMNHHIRTVIVAPMTTKGQNYATRVACKFKGKKGQIVLDQIRAVDKTRLSATLGSIDRNTRDEVLSTLRDMFSP